MAKYSGLKRYFTGKPCKRGHIADRLYKNRMCVKCAAEKYPKYVKRNPLPNKERQKRYRERHKEKLRIRSAQWRQDNQEKRKEISKKSDKKRAHIKRVYEKAYKERTRARTNERARLRHRRIYKENPQRILVYGRRRRARLKGAGGSHTATEIEQMHKDQHFKCAGCATCIANNYHVDHIMPIRLGGSNDIGNIQLLCPPCNARKQGKHPDKWRKEMGML